MLRTLAFAALFLVPPNLQPPEGQKLLFHAYAKGDQVYSCKQAASGWAWTLKEPDATLRDEKGDTIGRHFAGPTWAAEDGSRVIGKPVANQPSPDPDSIPWLLLTAVDHVGNGKMTAVESIQRLNTRGGKAPSGPCDASHSAEIVRAPYTAEYFFFGSTK